jgi:hypothetical protein
MRIASLLPLLLLPLADCGGDASPLDAGMDIAVVNRPPMPMLGRGIDRVGRAALATLLIDPFNLETARSQTALQAAYRHEGDRGQWPVFTGELTASLPIWDSLDGVCGNQLGAESGDGSSAYVRLADLLVDDRLYVDTSQASCAAYLGIEASALAPLNLQDCGGRTPTMDTVDGLYSALVVGAPGFTDPSKQVGDGVASALPKPSNTQFPFFQPPRSSGQTVSSSAATARTPSTTSWDERPLQGAK